MSALVELSWSSVGLGRASSSGMIRFASTLPSSTPHWSKESMLPDRALGEHAVLVERDERARACAGVSRSARITLVGRLPSHHAVGNDVAPACPSARDLLLGLAERERLGLGEHVRHQQVVVVAERVQGLGEADQVDRDQLRALVDQLVEAVLAVGPGSPQ